MMKKRSILVGAWDEGVRYEDLKNLIIKRLKEISERNSINYLKRKAVLVVLAIQLRNGLRASEAVEAYNNLIEGKFKEEDGKILVEYFVRKKRGEKIKGIAVFPEWVNKKFLVELKRYGVRADNDVVKVSCKKWLGVNTHTLRYARITYLADRGVAPQLIAKMTNHSSLNFILRYTQKKEAFDIAKEIE